MASGLFKAPYALFIIILMILGVVAGAFYFYNFTTQSNSCGAPFPYNYGQVYPTTLDNVPYLAVNINFTANQQNIVFGGVTFLTIAFSDPSLPHGSSCVRDNATPASVTLQATFSSDHITEPLPTILYKGTPSSSVPPTFTSHNSPKAGVMYQAGSSEIILLVST